MTAREGIEAEIRGLLAEACGALRLVSESHGPSKQATVRELAAEARRSIEQAEQLARRADATNSTR
jgi:hypothetical protein